MFKLYTFFRSSTSWRARIALNLKNIKTQYKFVHLFKGQQRSPQYKEVNPNTGVPTLILPTGEVIFQTMAIIEYLNQIKPQPHNLFPGSPLQRAQIRAFCQVINSGIHPYQNLRLVQKVNKQFGADKTKWTVQWMTQGLNTIQNLLKKNQNNKVLGEYTFGNKVTAADVFFYPQIMASKYRWSIDLSPYQRIQKILNNLQTIKQFKDANPQNQADYQK